jgi:hypothetical protein
VCDSEVDGEVVSGDASRPLPDATLLDGDPPDSSVDDGSVDVDGQVNDGQVNDGALADADSDGQASDASDGGGGGFDAQGPDAGCLQPNLVCDNVCTDVTSDSANCGACGKVCPSNSCVNGACIGNAAGHVISIGHDYQVNPAQNSSQARVIANAVFISKSNPIAVLSFEHYSAAQDVANVQSVLTTQAKKQGRSLSITSTSNDGDIPNTLDINTYDVLLVPDQRNAPNGTLATLGTNWSSNSVIADFLHAGGVIVMLDGGTGTGEMPDLETNMGVLSVSAHSVLANPSLTVLAPGDAVGAGLVSPYVPTKSCTWISTEPSSNTVTYVVGAGLNQPVVVHKVIP